VKGLKSGADDYLTKPLTRGIAGSGRVGSRVIELHRQIEAKNRLLEQLALTDALTDLPNRERLKSGQRGN